MRGVTPEIFYGTYVPVPGTPDRANPRLLRRSGLVDCLSVYGSRDRVDANTADPAVLAALGLPLDAVQLLLRERREKALTEARLNGLMPSSGPQGGMLRLGRQLHPHHPRHGARAAGQRSALRLEAHRRGAGEVHAARLRSPHPHPALVRHDVEQLTPAMALDLSISKDFRKLLAFGSGVGLEIGVRDLEVAVARVRPNRRPGAGPPDHRKLRARVRRRNGARSTRAS